jgi:hypothetical protein
VLRAGIANNSPLDERVADRGQDLIIGRIIETVGGDDCYLIAALMAYIELALVLSGPDGVRFAFERRPGELVHDSPMIPHPARPQEIMTFRLLRRFRHDYLNCVSN